ncbi:MAG: isoprenyl transferase [Anaerolineae bacterium]|jgi:undecaprenyl diphosphate synthase|nr:isoprenyl transferase [Anaerolineae bacterium]
MSAELNARVIPHHLAIIMDGNGRWANQHGLARIAGHQAGVHAVKQVTQTCIECGIQVLTLYTFSTENWYRPEDEVNFLMHLAEEYVSQELPDLQSNGIRLSLMGRRERLPTSLLGALDAAAMETRENTKLILNLAINYGGRAEITDAMKAIISDYQKGDLDISGIDETIFSQYLYCPETPDVDLIIRTSGEWRLSNFLVWRSASAVFWCTPVLWPDFQKDHLEEAISIYSKQILDRNND